MSHAILAVFYYDHQNPGLMMNPYYEGSNNVAVDDEYSATDTYFYNPIGKFDYVQLLHEHVPFYEWIEWDKRGVSHGASDIYAFLTPSWKWFDKWDDALDEKIPDEKFRKALKHQMIDRKGMDREELYVNIYDYHK